MEARPRATDQRWTLRVLRLTAAGLLLTLVTVVAVARGGASEPAATGEHTCSATDRKFIREAKLNLVAVGRSGRDFMTGAASAKDVLEDTSRAAEVLYATRPTDPALDKARVLVSTMFREYGKAVKARSRNRDAAQHMYRAYGLANFAHDVLAAAEPALREHGCDVSDLF